MSREDDNRKLEVTDPLPQSLTDASNKSKSEKQKELVAQLKVQWKLLWSERFNDKIRAEDVSASDYSSLYIERGTIIHATKDFKAQSFKEILEQHLLEDSERFMQPDLKAGGWSKFVKTHITFSPTRIKYSLPEIKKQAGQQQPKKGGRGWLHAT